MQNHPPSPPFPERAGHRFLSTEQGRTQLMPDKPRRSASRAALATGSTIRVACLKISRAIAIRIILKSMVFTSKKHRVDRIFLNKSIRLTTFGKIIVVCSENQFKLTNNFSGRNIEFLTLHSGICYYHPGQQSPKRGRINTLNEKLDFMRSTDFKLLRQI